MVNISCAQRVFKIYIYELMTDCQVKTQKCDFCFIQTSLNNDDQSCAHRLEKLKTLGGIVDEMMQLIAQD